MSFQKYFPTVVWFFRTFTSRLARRIYLLVICLLVIWVPVVPRLCNAYRARKFQAVLAGLEQVKVDQTTEAELVRLVPQLVRQGRSWKDKNGSVETWYGVELSNEFDTTANWVNRLLPYDQYYSRSLKTARSLGISFLSFGAGVLVRDGKVAKIKYGINSLGWQPRAACQTISVESFHGPWHSYPQAFGAVSSFDDENLRFRILEERQPTDKSFKSLEVKWTPDAPPELISHVYHLNLSCAWSLHGCINDREIAPELWQNAEETEAATHERLTSRDSCPDRILTDRVRYLPDLAILLLEVVDFQDEEVNEEGYMSEDFNTNYKVIEVIRGAKNYPERMRLRYRYTALTPEEGGGVGVANPMSLLHKPGDRLLFFTNLPFESCQLVPATPSALSVVRTTVGAPKIPEDEILQLQ